MSFIFFVSFAFSFVLWYFCATLLQWHAYQFSRVVFKFHKKEWILLYFVLPYLVYLSGFLFRYESISADIALAYALVTTYAWHNKLDKPLVFTGRVKRFLAIFIASNIVIVFYYKFLMFAPIISIGLAHFVSVLAERRLAKEYEQKAIRKLSLSTDLKVVAITASYGKTSIKNFLSQILSTKYRVYATPRSVNTRVGILKDINEGLPKEAEVYIVEAGARRKGDIQEIAELVAPHFAVIGKVGPAHIEYFKSMENIIATKSELLKSKRLAKAFVFENLGLNGDLMVQFGFENGTKISNVKSSLDGTEFELDLDGQREGFRAPVIGGFNAINISAAILVARELGMSIDEIRIAVAKLSQIEHRLQRIDAGGKVILDDSFNGNIDGMSEAIKICSEYKGKKVIVTPGLVEANAEDNKKIASLINDVFDLVILTGSLNLQMYNELINRPQKIVLSDKSALVPTLAKETASGDLIYFANDAPSYI